ncbi:hypothetical protein AA313_de0202084 [Arthrobotrys entomopaga]|nr:hypothetical protein AA313_de0202084 [Arthrobotrys entomopaga]
MAPQSSVPENATNVAATAPSLSDKYHQELIISSLVLNKVTVHDKGPNTPNFEEIAAKFKFESVDQAKAMYDEMSRKTTIEKRKQWMRKIEDLDDKDWLGDLSDEEMELDIDTRLELMFSAEETESNENEWSTIASVGERVSELETFSTSRPEIEPEGGPGCGCRDILMGGLGS